MKVQVTLEREMLGDNVRVAVQVTFYLISIWQSYKVKYGERCNVR